MNWLKGGSRPPLLDIIVAALLLAASAAPLAHDLWYLSDLMVPGAAMIGRDFMNTWVGGSLALQGHAAEIYSADYVPMARELLGRPVGAHNFSYPPTLLLFLWPLAFLAYLPALLIWSAATCALFILAARPYLRRAGLPLWIAAILPASLINLWAGHHGFVMAALWLAAFAAIDKRPLLAGLLIALLTLKPHMGVLIPLVLLVRREWRVIAVATAAAVALIAASLLVFGWQPWVNYFDWTAKLQAKFLLQQTLFFLNLMPTPYVGFWLASKNIALAVAGHGLVAIAAVAIVIRAARSAMPWPELGLVAATATFLVLPYAFNYDMAVVGLGAAMLLFSPHHRLGWIGRILALLALGTPVLVLVTNYFAVPILPLTLLGFLYIQYRAYAPPTPAAADARVRMKKPRRVAPGLFRWAWARRLTRSRAPPRR